MNRLISAALCVLAALGMSAAGHPTTVMKAKYRYDKVTTNRDGEDKNIHDDFILQIAPGESRFYSIKTQFIDSINATPGGKDMLSQMILDEINRNGGLKKNADGSIASISLDKSKMNIPTKGELFQVYKHFDKGQMDLFDNVANEDYTYPVPMDDLHWEIADSTKTVLGYECQMATASYHGRNWTAWFSPEIAVQDGPWQLFGLPGLIMEAATDDGDHSFTIEGLQQAAEQVLPIPGDKDFIKTERIKFRKLKKEYLLDPMKALAGYGVTAGDAAPAKAELKHEQLETDYNDVK